MGWSLSHYSCSSISVNLYLAFPVYHVSELKTHHANNPFLFPSHELNWPPLLLQMASKNISWMKSLMYTARDVAGNSWFDGMDMVLSMACGSLHMNSMTARLLMFGIRMVGMVLMRGSFSLRFLQ